MSLFSLAFCKQRAKQFGVLEKAAPRARLSRFCPKTLRDSKRLNIVPSCIYTEISWAMVLHLMRVEILLALLQEAEKQNYKV